LLYNSAAFAARQVKTTTQRALDKTKTTIAPNTDAMATPLRSGRTAELHSDVSQTQVVAVTPAIVASVHPLSKEIGLHERTIASTPPLEDLVFTQDSPVHVFEPGVPQEES
jgi:hypothetical protein